MFKTKSKIVLITAIFATLFMLFTLCSCDGTQSDGTTPDTQAETPDVLPGSSVELDISSDTYGFESEGATSTVTVKNNAINTVNPLLFGDNISWRYDGFGLWDRKNNRPVPELLEALRNSGVTSLRYPGGIEGDYSHWYEMIGDNRVPQLNPWKSRDAKKEVCEYPYFGYEEFFGVCEELGIPAVIQLNCGNGTPQEAADLVKWCEDNNKNVSSYCLGNEMHMGTEMVPGITVTKTPEQFVEFYLELYELLGDYVDDIEIGVVGHLEEHAFSYFDEWDDVVLTAVGDKIDFYDDHLAYTPYSGGFKDHSDEDLVSCYLASAIYIDNIIDLQLRNMKKLNPTNHENVTLQITEWGCLGGGSSVNSWAASVFHAAFLSKVTEEPRISSMSHFSALLTTEGAPTLIGYNGYKNVFVNEKEDLVVFENGQGIVFRWYSEQSNRSVLQTIVDSETFTSPRVRRIPVQYGVPTIYANVYVDEETGEGSIIIVNCNYQQVETDGVQQEGEENQYEMKNERTEIQLPFGVEITAIYEAYAEDPLAINNSDTAGNQPIKEIEYELGDTEASSGKVTVSTKPVSVVKIDFKKLDK